MKLNDKKNFLKRLGINIFEYSFGGMLGITFALGMKDLTDIIKLMKENKDVYSTFINWDNLKEEEKIDLMLEQIDELMEENKNYKEYEKETLKEKYPTFLKEYIEYFSNWDYLNTMLSTRYVKVCRLDKVISLNEEKLVGCDAPMYLIDTTENKDHFFHEKLHADNLWLKGFYETLQKRLIEGKTKEELKVQRELYASFGSNFGYKDIRLAYLLIGELIGPEQLEESILNQDFEKIWSDLETFYKNDTKKLKELEQTILEIYKANKKIENPIRFKEKFITLYNELYQKKYQKSPEEDLIASFLEDSFLERVEFETENKINYENEFLIEKIEMDLNNRNQNYKEYLTKYCLIREDKTYFKQIWTGFSIYYQKDFKDYQEFETTLLKDVSKDNVIEIFGKMVNCQNEEEYRHLIDWINFVIYQKDVLVRKRIK